MRLLSVSLALLAGVLATASTARSADDLGFPLPPGAVSRLGSHAMRQPGGVNALLFVGSDSRLLAAGTSGAIHSWDPVTGALMGRFGVNSRSLVGLMKTPDEQTFIATSVDDFIARYRRGDLDRPEEIRTQGVSPVVSPSLDRICVVADDLINFNLLDFDGKLIKSVESKGMRAVEAVFSDDGTLLAVTSLTVLEGKSKADKQPVVRIIQVHAPAGEDEVRTLNPPDGLFFKRVRFLPDNQRLVAAGIDGVIRIIDIEKMVIEPTAKFSVESASAMALSQDSSLVAVGDAAGTVSVFTVDGLTMIQNIAAHRSPVTSLAFTSDGARIATGGSDSTIRVFEVASGEELCGPRGHDSQVSAVAAWRDAAKVATGTHSGDLQVFDADSGESLFKVRANDGAVNRIAITPDGGSILTAGQNGDLTLFDGNTGDELRRVSISPAAVLDVAIAEDGAKAYATFADNRVRGFEVKTGDLLFDIEAISQSLLFSVAVSPNGTRIAIGASAIRIVDDQGAKILDIVDCRAPVYSLAFGADGATLVAGLADGTIRVYDVETGKELRRTLFGVGRVRRVAISADGRELFACSESENVARSYAFDTLEKLREFDGHREPLLDVTAAAGNRWVTASADTTAIVWKR